MPDLNPAVVPAVTPEPNASPATGTPGVSTPSPAVATTAPVVPAVTEQMVPLAALHEARDSIKELKSEMDALRNMQVQQAPQPQYPQAPQPNAVQQQMDELWESDPKRAMQTEIMMAINWYDQTNTALDVQVSEAAKRHTDFDTYRNDTRKYLRTLPADKRAQPGVVELAYYIVKGQKTDTIVDAKTAELIEKIKRGEVVQGITGTTSAPPVSASPLKPTQEQVNAAGAMGVEIGEYMKNVRTA